MKKIIIETTASDRQLLTVMARLVNEIPGLTKCNVEDVGAQPAPVKRPVAKTNGHGKFEVTSQVPMPRNGRDRSVKRIAGHSNRERAGRARLGEHNFNKSMKSAALNRDGLKNAYADVRAILKEKMPANTPLTAKQLAELAGVGVETIRGLLPASVRRRQFTVMRNSGFGGGYLYTRTAHL